VRSRKFRTSLLRAGHVAAPRCTVAAAQLRCCGRSAGQGIT